MFNDLSHSLCVTLIAIHNDVLLSLVVEVSHLLAEGLDSCLHKSLFGVNVEHTVSLKRELADSGDSVRELEEYLQVVLVETYTTADSNALLEVCSLGVVKAEEVSICINFKLTDFIGLVSWEFK